MITVLLGAAATVVFCVWVLVWSTTVTEVCMDRRFYESRIELMSGLLVLLVLILFSFGASLDRPLASPRVPSSVSPRLSSCPLVPLRVPSPEPDWDETLHCECSGR